MNADPIVFALANPNPEIFLRRCDGLADDIIFATGRSDYPNRINNVLGFPLYLPRRLGYARQGDQRG